MYLSRVPAASLLARVAVQRIGPAPGGIKSYLEDPASLLDEESRKCPFCKDGHRLRRHGFYRRYVILPEGEGVHRIEIVRLICHRERKTVSLLPDFCIPRKQHAVGLLGLFLHAWVRGATLLGALREARPDGPTHSVAQALLRAFERNAHHLRTYLAQIRARAIEPPEKIPRPRRALARIVYRLLEGFDSVRLAFEHHGRLVHLRLGVAIA